MLGGWDPHPFAWEGTLGAQHRQQPEVFVMLTTRAGALPPALLCLCPPAPVPSKFLVPS